MENSENVAVVEVVKNEQLEKIVSESGLQLNEGELIKQSYIPFFAQLAEIKKDAAKINFENPNELDESIARECRLKTVKIRTGSEKIKEDRKKIHSLRANLEQSAWNLIKTTCQLEEETFLQVEKKRERKELERIKNLEQERIALAGQYTDITFLPPGLGLMIDSVFDAYLTGLKVAHEAKIEAERKAKEQQELDRLAAIKKAEEEKVEQERIRIENEKLQKQLAEEKAKAEAEAKKQADILKAEKEKAENERLERERIEVAERARLKIESDNLIKAEKEKAEKLEKELKAKAEAEAKKQADILKAEKEKAENERLKRERIEVAERARLKLESDNLIKAEKEKAEKLEKELKAKAEAEAKEKARLLFEQKEKEKADKKAAQAPDKTKLNVVIDSFVFPAIDTKTEQAKLVYSDIFTKFNGFKSWAKTQIDTL